MSRQALILLFVVFPSSLLADISGTATLPVNSTFNFDTGEIASSGGDVLLTSAINFAPQGKAEIAMIGATYAGPFTYLDSAALTAYSYSTFAVALIYHSIEPEAIAVRFKPTPAITRRSCSREKPRRPSSFLYYTWDATGQPGVPSILQVQNNYSYILPNLPNYGIAPGSLFIIQGAALSNQPLSALQSSAAPGLPLTLNGTSVSVTVNGVTTQPAIYYTSPGVLGAVLPSSTPIGTGTIEVSNGSQASLSAPIQVVQSALGFDTLDGTGTGTAVATDANGNVIGMVNSALPGQTISLWGSGVGADPSNDDRSFPQRQNNLASIPFEVLIGGIQANVVYRGRSQYPGVDQINVVVPPSVQPGCYVSIAAISGPVVSNFVTLPVAGAGGACIDAALGIGASQAQLLASTGSASFGSISIGSNYAYLNFGRYPSGTLASLFGDAASYGKGMVSSGGCVVWQPDAPSGAVQIQRTPLDAGAITLKSPEGSEQLSAIGAGQYEQPYGSKIPSSGDAVTISSAGGANLGPFTVTLTLPAASTLKSSAALCTTQTQECTVSWTGGNPNGYVVIQTMASESVPAGWQFNWEATCMAPVSAGQFTVPPAVLLALPPIGGSFSATESYAPTVFSTPGLDWGYAVAGP